MPNNKLIKINLDPVKARLLASLPHSSDTKNIVRGLGAAAMDEWKRRAQTQLKSSARDYIAGLNHREEGDKAIITLDGRIPNMVEQGFSGGDMRQWLLTGPNAKMGKDGGMYNTVPFRHGTPGTGGRNVGVPMPKPIHQAAKKLTPTLSRPGEPVGEHGGRHTVYGQRLHPGLPMSAQAQQILVTKKQPWHATSIYMGMIRKGKHTVGGKVQTTGYTTFRRISSVKRDDKHWVHPGIKARNIAKQVQSHIESLADSIITAATS